MTKNAEEWVCDHCKTETFDSFSDTERHEKQCPSNAASKVIIDDVDNVNNKVGDHSWICDKCKVREFPTFEEALEHERNCKLKKKRYRCDVCKNVHFPTYDEALAHELLCGVIIPESTGLKESESLQRKPQEGDSLPILEKEIASEGEKVICNLNSSGIELAKTQGVSRAKIPEELRHPKLASPTVVVPISSTSCQNSESSLLTFKPLIRSPQDSQFYYKISLYYSTITSMVDLVEKALVIPPTSITCNVVSFQCTYCKSQWKPICTKSGMSEDLHMWIYAHVTSFCKLVPLEMKERIKKLLCQQDSGKMSFATFCDNFCLENGIGETKLPGDIPGLVALSDEEYRDWEYKNISSRRMRNDKPEEIKSDRQATNNIAAEEVQNKIHGTVMQKSAAKLGSYTIKTESTLSSSLVNTKKETTPTLPRPYVGYQIPVNAVTFPLKVYKHDLQFHLLNPFNMIAVDQIEFCVLHDTDHPQGFRKVVIQCKHCSNHTRLLAIDGWHKTVYQMAYTHLLKSCRLIPKDTRTRLNTSRTLKKKGKIGLKQYCTSVTNHYSLLQLAPNGINDFLCLGIPYDEASSIDAKCTLKRKLHHLSPSKITNKSLKPNDVDQPEINGSGTSKLVLYEKSGLKCYLPPVGGVPLLSTLTGKKHSKLSLYNKLLLGNLNLYEKDKTSDGQKRIVLQCQNCKSNPSLAFTVSLSKTENWHEHVNECFDHLEKCICTPEHVRVEIDSYRRKAPCNEEYITIKAYCDFLTGVYGLTNLRSSSLVEGVIWGPCQYGLSEYSSRSWELKELEETEMTLSHSRKTTISKTPRHKLMLTDPNSCKIPDYAKGRTTLFVTSETRHVLTDYNYLFISQLEFTPVQQPHSLPRPRSRRLKHCNIVGVFDVFDDSSSSSKSVHEKKQKTVQVGVSCCHCGLTKSIITVDNFVNIRIYQLYNHVQNCTEIPDEIRKKLTELKVSHKIQSGSGTLTVQEYLRTLIHEVYKMREFQINGANCGLAISSDSEVVHKYGKVIGNETSVSQINFSSSTSDRTLRLPFCLNDLVQPVSPSIEANFSRFKNRATEIDKISSG